MTYDSAGNVRLERVRINGTVLNRILTYNAANQLANVRINNVLVASYLYDHRSLRGRKTLSNPPAGAPAITLYTHDPNGHLFQEIAGSGPNIGQALVTYLWQDDVPAAIVLGPNTPGNPSAQDKLLYLEVDHLNTPRIARDEQKRVVWRWDSDAFGNTAPNEDPDGDGIKTTINLRFPGQYFDAESGLHYNWHRYYDPQVGRYTQPDPIGVEGGVNPYSYVDGSPLGLTDPSGLAPTKAVIWLVKICKTGIEKIRPVSFDEAVRLAKKGEADLLSSRANAKKVGEAASMNGRPVTKDPIHPDRNTGSTEGRRPHYEAPRVSRRPVGLSQTVAA